MSELPQFTRKDILPAIQGIAEKLGLIVTAKIDKWKSLLGKESGSHYEVYTDQMSVLEELIALPDLLSKEEAENVTEVIQDKVAVENRTDQQNDNLQPTKENSPEPRTLARKISEEQKQADRQIKVDKLSKLNISIEELTDRSRQAIESSPYAEQSIVKLGIKFNGNECFMKVISRDKQVAENHRKNNSHTIRMQQLSHGKEVNPLDNSFEGASEETREEIAKATRYHDEQNRLLSEKDSLAHMSIVIYSLSSAGNNKKTILGYSDFIVHKDDMGKVVVEAPVRALNLGLERRNEPGFNNPLYNALDVKSEIRSSGLGQFLVEIGSNIAAKKYGATERVFATDSTDRGEGSFYVNKLGAHLEKRNPYGQEKLKEVPVMSISEQNNEERTWPFLQKLEWI